MPPIRGVTVPSQSELPTFRQPQAFQGANAYARKFAQALACGSQGDLLRIKDGF
jgi:hypothetical protein